MSIEKLSAITQQRDLNLKIMRSGAESRRNQCVQRRVMSREIETEKTRWNGILKLKRQKQISGSLLSFLVEWENSGGTQIASNHSLTICRETMQSIFLFAVGFSRCRTF